MGIKKFANPDNIIKHRKDICKALEIDFTEDMLNNEYFIGTLSKEQLEIIKNLKLINRGFCPVCGKEPVGKEYHRRLKLIDEIEYLCEKCYEATNPYTEFKKRYYKKKLLSFAFMVIASFAVYLAMKLING